MKRKTGVFGGTFNPVHIGHLALANYLCEFGGLDELWFMVSPQNPLKPESHFLTDEQRLQLVRTAITGYPRFVCSDFEFTLPRPSYTIDTLDQLKQTFPQREFYLIMGADNWNNISRWKDSARLVSENNILVYPRPGFDLCTEVAPATVRFADSPLLEISSTFIRNAITAGKDIRYFMHPLAYDLLMAFVAGNHPKQ